MSVDKLVDSQALDFNLGLLANAIRMKNGGNSTYDSAVAMGNAIMALAGQFEIPGRTFTMGCFKFASNRTSAYSLAHGLGQTPETVWVIADHRPGSVAQIIMKHKYASQASTGSGISYASNSSGTFTIVYGSSSTPSLADAGKTECDGTNLTLGATSAYPFRANVNYIWFAFAAREEDT